MVRVISIILGKIYERPDKFFHHKDANGKIWQAPKRENLETFLRQILQKYSKVRTPVGVYQQVSGLSMESALSPILANILVNDLEQKIVKFFVNSGKGLHYSRFLSVSF